MVLPETYIFKNKIDIFSAFTEFSLMGKADPNKH